MSQVSVKCDGYEACMEVSADTTTAVADFLATDVFDVPVKHSESR